MTHPTQCTHYTFRAILYCYFLGTGGAVKVKVIWRPTLLRQATHPRVRSVRPSSPASWILYRVSATQAYWKKILYKCSLMGPDPGKLKGSQKLKTLLKSLLFSSLGWRLLLEWILEVSRNSNMCIIFDQKRLLFWILLFRGSAVLLWLLRIWLLKLTRWQKKNFCLKFLLWLLFNVVTFTQSIQITS